MQPDAACVTPGVQCLAMQTITGHGLIFEPYVFGVYVQCQSFRVCMRLPDLKVGMLHKRKDELS